MNPRPAHEGPAIGIDFGTSNSAVACVAADGIAKPLVLEGTTATVPTAIFFDAEDRSTHFGHDAVALYLSGTEGRLMRSLKSLLGSSLMEEQTEVNHQRIGFEAIISLFLSELAARATRQLGARPGPVVIGRPVHFVDDDRSATAWPKRRCAGLRSLPDSATSASSTSRSPQRSTTNGGSRARHWC